MDEIQNLIIFNESNCILCDHCISTCTENAIKYEHMNDDVLEFEEIEDSSKFVSYGAILKLFRVKQSFEHIKMKKFPRK